MPLVWARERDGEHNGKPCYEYTATCEDRTYHIVWAYDHGGTFGYTAVRKDDQGRTEYLSPRPGRAPHSITWCGSLTRCKAECEAIDVKAITR